jgi:predicted  nucleic acid-binding Zn-ribbon protein
MDGRKKQVKVGKDKSPYLRREEKDTDKAFKSVGKSVKPVAKDTNKTRRKETKARKVGDTVKSEKPVVSLKKALSKASKRCC